MPGYTGTSRLGLARLGAFRLGVYEAVARVSIAGVDRSGTTMVSGMTITDELNHVPNTASFRCRLFTPIVGQEVKLYSGDTHASHQLFAGQILSVEQGFEGKPQAPNVYWQVSAIDYTWLLNRRPVIARYLGVSATVAVQEVINAFTTGVGTAHVVTGLPVLDEITFTNEEVTDALTRIAQRIGGYWYVDYDSELHFFLTESETAGTITDPCPEPTSAPQVAFGAGGALTSGATYAWAVTFVYGSLGETVIGPSVSPGAVSGGFQTANMTLIQTGSAAVTARRVYRRRVDTGGTFQLVTTLADNVTTSYNDAAADGSLGTAPPATGPGSRGASDISLDIDLSQIATRVTARGGGSNTAADVAIGQTTIPLIDAATTWYETGGGTVEVGPNRVTYTGVSAVTGTGSTTGYLQPPPVQALVGGSGGSLTASSTYLLAMSYRTATGETIIGPTQAVALTSGQNELLGDFTVPTDQAITGKWAYISSANGNVSTMRKYGDTINVYSPATTFAVVSSYNAAWPTAPLASGAGPATEPTLAGSPTLPVEDLAQFAASGWADVGGQVFRYTGRSATTGSGTLTGIPASGIGSLTASVRSGTVIGVPHLTGIPASGAGSVLHAVNQGEPVNLIVTVNDTAAQTVMAGLVGGDGIHEMFISDGRWGLTEATARATAELTERKDPLQTVHLVTRDPSVVAGRLLTVSLTNPAISGTFRVQRVTITQVGITGPQGRLFPLRTVELSNRLYSFEDMVRQIRKLAA